MPYATMDPREFAVGWICALREELAAAQGMLDEEYDKRNLHTHSIDKNNYTLGRIGDHKIVITCLSGAGTTPATSAAIYMRISFPNVRFGFMVGIGAGVPSRKNDIRLGDVVVSESVIQHDSGKAKHDGVFTITHRLAPPPVVLLNATNEAAARSDVGGNRITRHLENMYTMHPHMKDKFQHPGPGQDRLFRPKYFHRETDSSCEVCDPAQLMPRVERTKDEPSVFHGIIASGNAVMKDGMKRDQLGEDHGALCIEMEAAGLMNDFPCLIIRGICDYADSHKNDRWQSYAAVTAAAYAKELLCNMTASHVGGTPVAPRPPIVEEGISPSSHQFRSAISMQTLEKLHRVPQSYITSSSLEQ